MGYDAPKPKPDGTAEPETVERSEVKREPRRTREAEPVRALNQSLEERACSGLTYNYGSDKEQRQRRRRPVSTGGF